MVFYAISKGIRHQLSGRLLKNFGWLTLGELLARVSRLSMTVILARLFTSYEYGALAIIFTTIEFANVFTMRGGIGSKLVQTDDRDLDDLCHTAYYLNWVIFSGIFIFQCLLSFPIAHFYNSPQVILPICVISLSYLIIPLFTVQGSLIQRGNRMKIIALANAAGTSVGCLLAAVLALIGIGVWSIIISYLFGQLTWLVFYLRCEKWRPSRGFTLSRSKELILFSKNVLGVELLDKLRSNLDYLIIGRVLGTEALGLYYFAFNSGLGISLSVISHFTYAVFPHLCSVRGNRELLRQKYIDSLKAAALITVPIVVLQSSLAPIYVPIIFSEKWIPAIPILILICLSALPRPFALVSSQLLLSVDQGHTDLRWNFIFTSIFAIFLFIVVRLGVIPTAVCVLVTHLILLPAFSIWVYRYVFVGTHKSGNSSIAS